MNKKRFWLTLLISFVLILGSSLAVAGKSPSGEPSTTMLASGLATATGAGSVIGPDGALYVTESAAGKISRVDPDTGAVTTFASGLPLPIFPLGGAMDVAFIDGTAYALVSIVGSDVGGNDVVGIYRIDGPNSATPIADIGAFSLANPPNADIFILTGVQYALEPFRGGLLVTDGHHNRLLYSSLDGQVSEMMAFGNIVPTGLEVHGNTILMAEAGPNPHLPPDGKIVAFGPKAPTPTEVASGAPLLVDVEYGLGRSLYALAQGEFEVGQPDGAPAKPNTGSLVEANEDGTFRVVVEGLDRPTSMEFIGNTAYVVTLGGEVWKIENVSSPSFGK